MGVTLDLRLIDHEHVVERGVAAVNEAIGRSDPSSLVEYLLRIPFTADSKLVASRQARCDQLRKLNAPEIIIQNEEKLLRLAKGETYSREQLSTKTLDELRQILGTWGWLQNPFHVSTAWYELDWFLQPDDGPSDSLMYPTRPRVGDPTQTLMDQALCGHSKSPVDCTGSAIIRSCGSDQEEHFGYNPPTVAAAIHNALLSVDAEAWNELIPQRIDQYKRASTEHSDAVEEIVEDELADAQMAFSIMRKAYRAAVEKGFGVACEYSL